MLRLTKKTNVTILTIFLLLVGISAMIIPSSVVLAASDNDDKRPDAYPEWDEDVYLPADTATARVVDSYMNQDPNKSETVIVDVYVRGNMDDGISITLTETNTDTGIFEGIVLFSETEESGDNRLKVTQGDKVYVDYAYFEVVNSDNIEDMIVIGDGADISSSNSQTSKQQQDIADVTTTNTNADIQDESDLVYVKLDKKIYTWTDKVNITVSAPSLNLDDNLAEEIGDTEQNPINISTKNFALENYKLIETGTDTGIFTGEIILTGFLHDADGSGKNDHLPYEDTTPRTSGSGPTDGLLQSDNNDTIVVSVQTSPSDTVVGSAIIQWNTGQVKWLESSYSSTGTGVIRVIDPDMNWDPKAVDNFDVDVWSDSDAAGVDLTVSETNANTGIFEGTVFFSTTDESSGHRLFVTEGDTITAEYEDNTLPKPYTTADELDITDTSMIQRTTEFSPHKQMMMGINPDDITCKEDLEKFFRFSGDSVVCVEQSSVEKLIQRGYIIK